MRLERKIPLMIRFFSFVYNTKFFIRFTRRTQQKEIEHCLYFFERRGRRSSSRSCHQRPRSARTSASISASFCVVLSVRFAGTLQFQLDGKSKMINSSDILQLCRLCLVEDKVNHPIFEESDDLRSISLKISSCLPVSIHKDDSLPKKICDTCSTKLDSFYQFWSESANAEKQLLQWVDKNKTSKQQADQSRKMETTEVKKELEDTVDPIDMTSEAQTYILQQQQLPYTSSAPNDSLNTSESEEPAAKRPRRASAVKALQHMGSEDEDDAELAADNYAKTESDDSDKEEEDEDSNYQENPSTTSVEDQPGPSGMSKKKMVLDDTPVFPLPKIRPCHVVLNNIQGLLDEDGVYIVPGRSRRNLTCYRCFRKFNSAESLEVHKAEHEPESEEENVYAVSDSEMEIESESEEETNELVEVSSKIQQKTPSDKVVEKSPAQKVAEPVQNVPKPPETALQKQVQVVEPIRSKVEVIPKPQPVPQEKKSEETKKVPVLCNIQIRCLTCDVLFTNSELLMKHQPVNAENQCCFTCKVCTESYSQPEDYLNHIMQHNTFSSSRYGYRGGPRKKPEFRCTYCRLEFDHRFQLQQHESSHHKTPEPIAVAPAKIQVAPAKIQVVPVSNPPSLVPVVVLNDTKKPVEEKPAAVPTVDLSTSSTEEQEAPKPKIWVIKEAMMKSPEPAVEPRAAITSTGLSAVKRNIDQLQSHEELLKPAKRGRPSKTGSVTPPVILNPTVPAVGIEVTTSLTCDVCFDVFQNRAAFEEHMVFHGVKKNVVEPVPAKSNHVGTPEAAHECPTCKLHFKSHAGLRRHQTCAHENRKITSFVCDKCSKIFSSRKGLNIHKSSCLGNTVEDRQ